MAATIDIANDIRRASSVLLCGNGGSAANAIHMANDLWSVGVNARSLCEIATLTAIANDIGYEHVFGHQIKVAGSRDGLLICLSGSGNSPNILRAIKEAKKKGMTVWAITGAFNRNKAQRLAHRSISVGDNMQAAEEQQLVINHRIMKCLRSLANLKHS